MQKQRSLFPAHGPLHGWLLLLGVLLPGGGLPLRAAHAQLAAPPLASTTAPLVFRGVTVIDVREGRRVANQAVVVVGQTITPIHQAVVPRGARVVDARGQYLIPGLWDMHVHPTENENIAYPLFITNGVTGVRDAGSAIPLETLRQWKQEIAAGSRVGPRLIVSGSSINEAPSGQTAVTKWGIGKIHLNVPPALMGQVVDSLQAAGADPGSGKFRGVLRVFGGS